MMRLHGCCHVMCVCVCVYTYAIYMIMHFHKSNLYHMQLFSNSAAALPAEIDEHGNLKASSRHAPWKKNVFPSWKKQESL